MHHQCFATDKTPWCVWEGDHQRLTETFLRTFDAGYFEYLANTHIHALDGDDHRHAATAMRATYSHAMETLFALLAATIQAPNCVPGWIQQYTTGELISVVEKVTSRAELLTRVNGPQLTWESMSQFMLKYVRIEDKEKETRVKDAFGQFWSRLAHEFLDQHIRAEYNSVKHGFRVSSGGSTVAIGIEETPGVPCPPEKMQVIGGGEHGSSFFEPVKLTDKRNFRLIRQSLNWDPYSLAGRIRLIARSLSNIISFLKVSHGAAAESVRFVWPAELDDFEEVWKQPSLLNSSIEVDIRPEDIQPKSKDEILAVYQRGESSTSSASESPTT
jgi:hypothetical protein